MSLKRSHDEATRNTDDRQTDEAEIFESSPIEDRSSTFIAIFSPTLAPRSLQAHQPLKKASHRILAWRTLSKQQSLKVTSASGNPSPILHDVGSDDDGEKYTGKKLEKLLVEMDITGAVVVARWYGGVLLGPVRFDHVVNAARGAIQKWQTSGAETSSKKLKLNFSQDLTPEQEAEKVKCLAKQLQDRDNSIKVLRDLLTEKKASKENEVNILTSPKSSQTVRQDTTAGPDYHTMPLAKLKQLEKARDTTISWILKQIDQIEADEKVRTEGG